MESEINASGVSCVLSHWYKNEVHFTIWSSESPTRVVKGKGKGRSEMYVKDKPIHHLTLQYFYFFIVGHIVQPQTPNIEGEASSRETISNSIKIKNKCMQCHTQNLISVPYGRENVCLYRNQINLLSGGARSPSPQIMTTSGSHTSTRKQDHQLPKLRRLRRWEFMHFVDQEQRQAKLREDGNIVHTNEMIEAPGLIVDLSIDSQYPLTMRFVRW